LHIFSRRRNYLFDPYIELLLIFNVDLAEVTIDYHYDESKFFGTCIFGNDSCNQFAYDSWVSGMFGWVVINVAWVTFLVVTQLGQIFVGYTTNESANYRRFDYLTHPDDINVPQYRKRTLNPFNIGPIGNFMDFWFGGVGKLKDISWYELYEVPSDLLDGALRKNGYSRVVSDHKSIESMV
jgi:hypothetical protein